MDSFRAQLQANAAQWMSRTASTAPKSPAISHGTRFEPEIKVSKENVAPVVLRATTVVSEPSVTAAVDAHTDQDEAKIPPITTDTPSAESPRSMTVETGTNIRPSLKVDPCALQEARAFMSSWSDSRTRQSHSRLVNSRTILSSTQGSPKITHAAEDLPASSPNRLPPQNTFPTPQSWTSSTSGTMRRPTQMLTSNSGTHFDTNPSATEQKPHKATPKTANITTPEQAFSIKNDDDINALTSALGKTLIKDNGISSQTQNNANGNVGCLLTDITNTATKRDSDNRPYRHEAMEVTKLNGKTVATVLQKSSSVTPKPTNPINNTQTFAKSTEEFDIKPPTAQTFSFTCLPKNEAVREERITPRPPATFAFQVKPLIMEPLKSTPAEVVSNASKQNEILPNGHTQDHPFDTKISNSSDISATLTSLQQHIALLEAKIDYLEIQNMDMSRRMENLIVSEEKRRGYGTDGIKVPFKVTVTFPDDARRVIDVTGESKVSVLIRRAAEQAGVRLQGKAPRIVFRGEQLGHGMTMEEAGVRGNPKVSFSY